MCWEYYNLCRETHRERERSCRSQADLNGRDRKTGATQKNRKTELERGQGEEKSFQSQIALGLLARTFVGWGKQGVYEVSAVKFAFPFLEVHPARGKHRKV